MGNQRTDARTPSHPARRGMFAVLVGALVVVGLIAPSGASAADPSSSCMSTTSGSQTTYRCNIPTGRIGGYDVRQWYVLPQSLGISDGVPKLGADGYITHMETDVIDAATGEQVPISRLMLHHIVFLNLNRHDSTCAGQGFAGFDGNNQYGRFAPQRFYAAGEERMKMSMPPGYGYKTNPGDQWAIVAMVMNHRSTPDNALIHYEVTVDNSPGIQAVKPYWLDVRDCRADPIYNIPSVARKAKAKKEKQGRKAVVAKKRKKGKKKKPKRAAPISTESRDYVFPESGRLIAAAGHIHGGAVGLTLTEPGCGNREVGRSDPTWGLPDHPFYNVRPVLHEPGPINMSAFRSTTGLPINAGETIRLNSIYDNSLPHVRVMGIMVAYLAPDPSITQNCGPVPGWEVLRTEQPGRLGPIPFTIPLTGLDANGQATTIKAPPGRIRGVGRNTVVPVGDRFFSAPNLRVTPGSWVTWQFNGAELHNVTLANGPLGIGSGNLDAGRTFTQKFTRPGTYRLFCALHPVQMQERIVVAPKKAKKR